MRHSKSGRKLGRNPSHRKALLRNMAKALVVHGRITTTEAKAKTLRGVVEPLITLALTLSLAVAPAPTFSASSPRKKNAPHNGAFLRNLMEASGH